MEPCISIFNSSYFVLIKKITLKSTKIQPSTEVGILNWYQHFSWETEISEMLSRKALSHRVDVSAALSLLANLFIFKTFVICEPRFKIIKHILSEPSYWICLNIYLYIYLIICISLYLSICISSYIYNYYIEILIFLYFIDLSILLTIYISICLSVFLSNYWMQVKMTWRSIEYLSKKHNMTCSSFQE